VYEGRAWDRIGAHTLGWNNVAVSVCFMGDYSRKMPPSGALAAARALIDCGVQIGKIAPDYILCGHRDLRATEGPGETLYRHIQTWDHYDCGIPPAKPEPLPYKDE